MEENPNKIKIPDGLKTLVSKSRKKHQKKEQPSYPSNASRSPKQFNTQRQSIKHHSPQKPVKNGEFKVQKLHFYAS